MNDMMSVVVVTSSLTKSNGDKVFAVRGLEIIHFIIHRFYHKLFCCAIVKMKKLSGK